MLSWRVMRVSLRVPSLFFPLACLLAGCSGGDDGGAGSGSAGAGCPDDGSGYEAASQSRECEVLALVNQRRQAGATCEGEAMPAVSALAMSAQLRQAARAHAVDMATQNFFSHDGLDGSDPGDRIQATGYQFRGWGENIAAGSSTAEAVMEQWMNSGGHCRNIMNGSFRELGVGHSPGAGGSRYPHYWVQVFGTPR